MKKIAASLTILCAMVCSFSFAQSTSGTPDSTVVNFATNAAMSDMKEIAAGKLAKRKAKDPAVKAYAAQMVEHHTMTSKQMMALTKTKGYKIPPPSMDAAAPDSMLVSAKGADFDKMYMTMMVSDHEKAVQLFQTASTNVSDADYKALAVKTLPLLKQHLTSAQSLSSKLGASTTATSGK